MKERRRVREESLKHGMRPYVVNGVWDGFTVEDDDTGRLRDLLLRYGGRPAEDGVYRTVLVGSIEREARRMAAEGFWGPIARAKKRR